jgi:2,3-diketo-5-methylthio-1-phosphopentane phosphatase
VSAIVGDGFIGFPAVYIAIVARDSKVLVLDFDGTVTDKDVGDEICDRFAPPTWRDIDAEWVRNEISLPEAQRRMWALARAEREAALAHARDVGHLRPGLDALLDGATARGWELWLASGGFDFYIEAILGERLQRFTRVHYNRARFIEGRIDVEFPHGDLACGRCAVCKGVVCDRARAVATQVWFVGDGASDRCVIGRADRVFAVSGSLLERACRERDAACTAFTTFDEILG